MITRRQFLKLGAGTAAIVMLNPKVLYAHGSLAQARQAATAPLPGGTLDPMSVPKFAQPLVIPPAMPQTKLSGPPGNIDYYEIAVRQFTQKILHPDLPATTVWGYGSVNHPTTFNYPSFTIEARRQRPVRVKWINGLIDDNGTYLQHLLPVDQTLHWANPPGGLAGRDTRPTFTTTPGPYRGPVPMVPHLHGGHTSEQSDGFPEAWFLPAAQGIPDGYAREGRLYDHFRQKAQQETGVEWEQGTAVYQYDNDQPPSTLWFHDHTLGMTRVNVYAGPAGFYLLRSDAGDPMGGQLPGPAPALGDKPGTKYYEIPIAIQDRSFNSDGSLFYPDSREFFDGIAGPYLPETDVSPIWNPEFFGNTMVVNGKAWPVLDVERRRYRFRFLNGCDSRFLILKLSNNMPFWQIGAEGGFLPRPVQLTQLLMSPAERADVIVDFTDFETGTEIILENVGPDEPFGGGEPGVDFDIAHPGTTGKVMKFRVVPATSKDMSVPPSKLNALPGPGLLFGKVAATRQLSLNEMMSMTRVNPQDPESPLLFDGPAAALLGTITGGENGPEGVHLMWADDITENPALGSTEIWEIFNFTEDAHPIHIHEVQVAVLNRQPFSGTEVGDIRPPEVWEAGPKDTFIAYPGEITRVMARFDRQGLYVWHCHIIEHEDNEMMRPYYVGTMPAVMPGGLRKKVRPKWWRENR